MEGVDTSERHWGIWYLSKSTPLRLNNYLNWRKNSAPYEVAPVKLNSEAKVLHWINYFFKSGRRSIDTQALRRACKTLQNKGLIRLVSLNKLYIGVINIATKLSLGGMKV